MNPHNDFDLFDQWVHGFTTPLIQLPTPTEDEWWRDTQPEGGFDYTWQEAYWATQPQETHG